VSLLTISTYLNAQTVLFSENFETCSEGFIRASSPLCGWVETVTTTSDNSWTISNNNPISGSNSLTIGDWWAGSYYDYYTGDNCDKIAYKNIMINAVGYSSLLLDFKWRSYGENNYDYGMVVYSFNGTTWFDVSATRYQLQSTTQTVTALALPAALNNTNFYLGFRWINDGSVGSDPPFAVDDISVYVPCSTVAGTSSSSVTTSCGSTNTTLSLAGEGAGAIQWQQSTNGGATWNDIVGATTDPYVHSVSVNTMYRAAVTNGCTSYSSTSSISFSCPDIIHPSSGTNSTTIQCGGSYSYRDPGNTGNYSNNLNGLLTICPSSPGQYVNVNFTSFNTEASYDYVYVFDGYDAHAPLLGVYAGNNALLGNVKATSSNSSGCLSFRFFSDGATTTSGWEANVTCSGTPSAITPTTNIEDCQGAVVVCGDASLVGGTTGGGYHELPNPWNSCIDGGENESQWYVFSPSTSGTVGFQITPNSPTDYDWAIWGPYTSLACPAFTNDTPVRCSSTQLIGNGNTGLVAPATDVIEQNGEYGGGTNENGFLRPLTVLVGEVYVMMLDNWSATTVGFQLDWTLSNGATLDCTPVLPVNLASFTSSCEGNNTVLNWVTETETNNDYFAIEKSDENFQFYEIGRVSGNGNSNATLSYNFEDNTLNTKTAYYRLKQVDYNGEFTYHRIIASNCFINSFDVSNIHLTDNKLDMIISSSSNEELMVYLYESTGRLVSEQKTTVNSGNNKFSLQNLNINSGIYFVTVIGKQNKFSGKIIKE
jgi:hypothetical protein